MDEFLGLLREFGFPVAVVCWLLYERRAVIKELQTAVQANTAATIELVTVIREELRNEK